MAAVIASPTELVELDYRLARPNHEAEISVAMGPIGRIRTPLGHLTLDLAAVNAVYNVMIVGGNASRDASFDLHNIDPDAVTFVWPDQTSLNGLMIIAQQPKDDEDDEYSLAA